MQETLGSIMGVSCPLARCAGFDPTMGMHHIQLPCSRNPMNELSSRRRTPRLSAYRGCSATAGLCVLLIATTAGAKQPLRYVAKLADETRLEHDDLVDWHAPEATPRLGGRPLLAPQNPLVWLLDRQQPPSDPPAAFIELFTGDRLPGTVVGYQHDQPADVYREVDHWIVQIGRAHV